jgi:ATP-binding protein involved in chromosome partitioning
MKKDKEDEIKKTLSRIKTILLVFSGKGGVGKSTVAANLGLALSKQGQQVGLIDIDIHGPNLAKMLGVEGQRVFSEKKKIIPVLITENLKLISMSFLLESPDLPVIWRGPLKMKIIQQFLGDVNWGDLDWLIIDSPPGTGDEPLSIAQLIPATGAVIVTTPQEVSLLDSRKAITFARKLNLRVVGVIENMSGLACPHCGKRIELFKKGGGEKIAKEMGVPFLGKVPIEPHIVESGDRGVPFILENPDSEASQSFKKIVEKIIEDSKE